MRCLSPITLKNGLVVPCGKCELCLSHKRDDWSIRLQLHAQGYERMPLFITLTYAPEHLVYGAETATLFGRDVRLFIKRYKDRYHLYNTDFSYFGCGEYGDARNSSVGLARPHYHLLFFGDNELYDLFDKDVRLAEKRLYDVWQKGICHCGIAEWSGVHYVTKYCLKENPEDYGDDKVRPFTISSHGLGLAWLKSPQARMIALQLSRLTIWKREYLDLLQNLNVDVSDIDGSIKSLKRFFANMPDFPDFSVVLDSGKKVFLPRELRRRLVGSFEHFKDSPLWLFEYYSRLLDSLIYYRDNREYDLTHELPISAQINMQKVEKIRERLIINKHKKLKHENV